MDDLQWASAVTQARLLRDGAVSVGELRAGAIAAIERLDPVLHAVVIPLFDRPGGGVPMLLKDAGQELAGTPHWVGVAALRDSGSRSLSTTALATQFERAGFSIVGKGACAQLANGATTEPPGFEPTRNPWDLARSAGGSSGGSAVAVASGMVAVAHGSDATGSLRCPAALCGVATLNPTAGRVRGVPPAGQPPNDAWRDFVLARHSEDLSAVFTASPAPARRRRRERCGSGSSTTTPSTVSAFIPGARPEPASRARTSRRSAITSRCRGPTRSTGSGRRPVPRSRSRATRFADRLLTG